MVVAPVAAAAYVEKRIESRSQHPIIFSGTVAQPQMNLAFRKDTSMCISSDDLVAVAEMAVSHKSAKHVENDSRGELRRVVVDVVGRRDFDHLHAA